MAVNITQRNSTLHEVIRIVRSLHDDKAGGPSYDPTASDRAYMRACNDVIDECERMLEPSARMGDGGGR